jgi:hypothetical protein
VVSEQKGACMRPILCYQCSTVFRGKGTSRVMRKLLFHFCAKCWRDRRACELHMIRTAAPELLNEVAA